LCNQVVGGELKLENREKEITDKTIGFWATIVLGVLAVFYIILSFILGESISSVFTYDVIIFLILIMADFTLSRVKVNHEKNPRAYKLVYFGKILMGILTVFAVAYVIIVNFIL